MSTSKYQSKNYNRSQYIKTQKLSSYGQAPTQTNLNSVNRYFSSSGNNLRNSKVTRKTVYGEKYDYGEKVKEKRNYLLYVSGTLREKKEIEEIEQLPSEPKFLEEKEIIDNYQYHESKNLKNQNPNRLSITQHKRLSSPFEKTTIRAVTDDGASYQYGTKTVTKNQRLYSLPKKNVQYEKYEKFETYQPQKKYSYHKKYDYTPINKIEKSEILKEKKMKIPFRKYENNFNDNYQYNSQNDYYEQEIKRVNQNNSPYRFNRFNKNKFNDEQAKTETKKDGDYLVRTTVSKKTIESTNYNKNYNNNYNNNYNKNYNKNYNTSYNKNYNTIETSNVRNLRNRVEENNYSNNYDENYGDNYRYYESKNVKKCGRKNRPITYHSRRKGSEERTSKYSKNFRNVIHQSNQRNQSNQSYNYGRGNYEESRTYEQRRVRKFENNDYGNERQFKYLCGEPKCKGKYETYEEVNCPIHGRQTVKKEYVY